MSPLQLVSPEMYSVLFTSNILSVKSKPPSQMTLLFELLHISTITRLQWVPEAIKNRKAPRLLLGTQLVPNKLQQINND